MTQNQGPGWTVQPCAAESGTRFPLGHAPTTPNLLEPSSLSQISMPGGLAPGQQRQIHASLAEGPSLYRGQCLTRMSPLDSCRQCRASSWLVPAPGKMLEQAAVSRSSTALWEQGRKRARGGRRGSHFQSWAGLGLAPHLPNLRLCLLAQVPSHLASASPGCSLGPPMAATPSQPCGGLQLPGHGPSLRGFLLGTGSLR